jgi:methylated-DNA-[protein]-cysteine S-methyltransferase
MELFTHRIESPIGGIVLSVDSRGALHELGFAQGEPRQGGTILPDGIPQAAAAIAARLARYFRGELEALDDIAVAASGSDLRQRVWAAVRRIPPGSVASYGEIAARLGYDDRRMARSIGTANANNPVAIVIPCHRVIAKDGGLRGYAWGLARKQWLLDHERARQARRPSAGIRPAAGVATAGAA